MNTFKLGDRVIADPNAEGVPSACLGRVYIVRKINPRNLRCEAEDGGRGISFPPRILLPASAAPLNRPPSVGVPFVPREGFTAGEIVTLKRAYRDITTETPMVVLKDNEKRVNVAKLGGEGDRYVRVPPSGLVKRDIDWLTTILWCSDAPALSTRTGA